MPIEPFDEVLLDHSMDKEVTERPVRHRGVTEPLGRLLAETGKISPEDAEKVAEFQKVHNLRFGEAALQLGLVSEDDIRYALARQFDYPYLAPGQNTFGADLITAYSPNSEAAEAFRIIEFENKKIWENG